MSETAFALASDKRLARRAAAGDPEAFAAIFRRYHRDLHRFCVGILREPQDAEDAVQNTMIRAMRALPGERREMELKPWLYRIAHNEAVELRRRDRPVEQLAPTIDDGAVTEEVAERDAKLHSLLADIADLPERQRAALVMREVNGLGFGEIADALGTSPGAVRQALYEARRGLSQMELGRDMDCESAMRQVSDAEGRPRRRGVRAHLRGCAGCRRFQAEICARKGSLAAISPLPGLALVGLLRSAPGGSVGSGGVVGVGGAGAGAGAAAGSALAGSGAAGAGAGSGALVGVAAAGAGAGSGALAGAAVTAGGGAGFLAGVGASGAAKAGVGLLAAIAVGTATVDHDALLRHAGLGSSSVRQGQAGESGGAARPGPAGHAGGAVGAALADRSDRAFGRHVSPARRPAPGVAVEASAVAPSTVAVAGTLDSSSVGKSKAASTGSAVGSAPVEQSISAAPGRRSAVAAPEHVVAANANGGAVHVASTSAAERSPAKVSAELATHSERPAHTAHPDNAGDAGNGGPEETGAHADTAAHAGTPEHPAHPEHPAKPAAEAHATEASVPVDEAPASETTEPLPEAATPAPVAATENGNGNGLAKGHAKQVEEGE
ncbi:MAG TPA: sigma-70 family RNA polymerase sigma factor [Solirubrobacterales bacterium]|nr:sigma-70 family RNA polymerase sigma factor [Solirubrobacterales bacterium]